MSINIKPLGERIIVKAITYEESTKSGIIMPQTAKEAPQEGIVIAVGEGRVSEYGAQLPMLVKPGDKIIYSKYAGTELKRDGVEYLILNSERDVLCIVEE